MIINGDFVGLKLLLLLRFKAIKLIIVIITAIVVIISIQCFIQTPEHVQLEKMKILGEN